MPQITLTIAAAEGYAPATLFTPEGQGPWPGVLMFMDGPGIRPALKGVAQRIADLGYAVLLPDTFYRVGGYPEFDFSQIAADPSLRPAIMERVNGLGYTRALADTGPYLDALQARPEVAAGPVGTVGYCMGGGMALNAAGVFPDRVAAALSFHGGRLADPTVPDSAHTHAAGTTAELYVGVAVQDGSFPAEQEALLKQTYDALGLVYRMETYDDCLHGWTVPGSPVFNEAGSERHFAVIEEVFGRRLASARAV